jgi:hypothetical protein
MKNWELGRAQRETEMETDRFLINQKPTDGQFIKGLFSVFPLLVGFGL